MPGPHMNKVPTGADVRSTATSMKADAQSPSTPPFAQGTGFAPPTGGGPTPPATSTKANATSPTTPGFATGQPGSFSTGGAHGGTTALGGNTGSKK